MRGSADAVVSGDAGDDAGVPLDAGPTDLRPVDPPPPVTFPDTLGTLSVAVRTADGANAGTDDPMEFCLSAERCFRLDTPDVDDFRVGELDIFHFEGLSIPRDEITRVELRTASVGDNNDRFTAGCLEVRFDGEPVYCNDAIPGHIGIGPSVGEVPSFVDPAGLHEVCTTCQVGTLTHGPMQGAPTAGGARIWVRTDATRRVGLRMARPGEPLDDGPIVAWVDPRPEQDFNAELTPATLESDVSYQARLEVAGEVRGAPFTVRAAPEDRSTALRVALGSCTRYDAQPAFAHVHSHAPDTFVFLGDNHYGNTSHIAAHRHHYRRFRAVPERAMTVRDAWTLATWDDHDFVGNNATATCAGRDEAKRAFLEFFATPVLPPGPEGIYHAQRIGPVEFFMMDSRTFRPEVGDPGRRCDEDPSAVDPGRAAGMFGPVQVEWLLDALEASTAPFKFVANGSRWTDEGSRDSWSSFLPARNALFDAIDARGIEGVVLLSGDIHRSNLAWVDRPSGYRMPEITSSPLANSSGSCPDEGPNQLFCHSGISFAVLDVDTALDDPMLTVSIRDDANVERYNWVIRASELR